MSKAKALIIIVLDTPFDPQAAFGLMASMPFSVPCQSDEGFAIL